MSVSHNHHAVVTVSATFSCLDTSAGTTSWVKLRILDAFNNLDEQTWFFEDRIAAEAFAAKINSVWPVKIEQAA